MKQREIPNNIVSNSSILMMGANKQWTLMPSRSEPTANEMGSVGRRIKEGDVGKGEGGRGKVVSIKG